MARGYFIRRLKFRTRGEARKRKYRGFGLRFQTIFHREHTFYSVVYLYLLVRFFRHFASLCEIYTRRKNCVTGHILITHTKGTSSSSTSVTDFNARLEVETLRSFESLSRLEIIET